MFDCSGTYGDCNAKVYFITVQIIKRAIIIITLREKNYKNAF